MSRKIVYLTDKQKSTLSVSGKTIVRLSKDKWATIRKDGYVLTSSSPRLLVGSIVEIIYSSKSPNGGNP